MSDLDITNHHTICAENELNTVNILFEWKGKDTLFPDLEILSHLKPPRKHINVLLVVLDGLVELISLKP